MTMRYGKWRDIKDNPGYYTAQAYLFYETAIKKRWLGTTNKDIRLIIMEYLIKSLDPFFLEPLDDENICTHCTENINISIDNYIIKDLFTSTENENNDCVCICNQKNEMDNDDIYCPKCSCE